VFGTSNGGAKLNDFFISANKTYVILNIPEHWYEHVTIPYTRDWRRLQSLCGSPPDRITSVVLAGSPASGRKKRSKELFFFLNPCSLFNIQMIYEQGLTIYILWSERCVHNFGPFRILNRARASTTLFFLCRYRIRIFRKNY
jgi:hypothetical protein